MSLASQTSSAQGISSFGFSGPNCSLQNTSYVLTSTGSGDAPIDFFQTVFDDYVIANEQAFDEEVEQCRLNIELGADADGGTTQELALLYDGFIDLELGETVVMQRRLSISGQVLSQAFRVSGPLYESFQWHDLIDLSKFETSGSTIQIDYQIKFLKSQQNEFAGVFYLDNIRGLTH